MEGDAGTAAADYQHAISIHSLRMEGDGNALPQIISAILFQSTPSAWRETQGERHSGQCGHISIHSLRMEGDITSSLSLLLDRDFNPLPPHGGRPCRRTGSHSPLYHFNPLPPHGGRLSPIPRVLLVSAISIHSLRMEGDHCQFYRILDICIFQSTPSAWRETLVPVRQRLFLLSFQSTPSAWRETQLLLVSMLSHQHFNPLPPHGGRPNNRL